VPPAPTLRRAPRPPTRSRVGGRRRALRLWWQDIDDDPVLLCECADGEHTC